MVEVTECMAEGWLNSTSMCPGHGWLVIDGKYFNNPPPKKKTAATKLLKKFRCDLGGRKHLKILKQVGGRKQETMETASNGAASKS